jgi:hypothetical protein
MVVTDAAREEAAKVWFFVPNLIGYARIATALLAFHAHAQGAPETFFWWYATSYALDAVDGVAARSLHQGTCRSAGAGKAGGGGERASAGVEMWGVGAQRLSSVRFWTW